MSEVTSVNSKTGAVVLKAADVEAVPTSEIGQPSGVASLNGSGKLPEAQLMSSVETGSFTGDATGATDIGPALQEAFEKEHCVTLKRNGNYLVNSGVFLDSASLTTRYVLDLNGATIKFGPGLPSASGMTEGQAATKWAFFNNTLRSALAGGEVTTSEGTRATTTKLAPFTRLIIKNGVLSGQTNIVGVIYGNGCTSRIEDCTFQKIQYGISWVGYCDGNTVENIQMINEAITGSTTLSTLIFQRENGDATSAIHCKMFGGIQLDLRGSYGFRAASTISGQFIFNQCVGMIEASHQDTDASTEPPFSVVLKGTKLTYIASRTNASHKAAIPTIRIEDEAGKPSTWLDLIDHTELFHTNVGAPGDPERGATLEIVSLNEDGRVRSTGFKTVLGQSPEEEIEGPYMTSSVAGITTAFAAGADQIATGDFELRYGGLWYVTPPPGRRCHLGHARHRRSARSRSPAASKAPSKKNNNMNTSLHARRRTAATPLYP